MAKRIDTPSLGGLAKKLMPFFLAVSLLSCSSGVFTVKDVAGIRPGTKFRKVKLATPRELSLFKLADRTSILPSTFATLNCLLGLMMAFDLLIG